ncbi:dolichyl-phosphate-mannose-protein mannosyltransferase [Dyadobacter jejuensis]|uniref:Dolichyl-phosphate-mannose-protein mannosyltransferase n=1 Tax=Dyadobacter jejuensis TaxID=1082580 RepID=A0A316ADD0_9BACT|nr:glycosyltransferase family 39 protein [Dyadobacter jejuensis]PWJ55258.1 dolichyl-phosphate-mannose-protein mannosyltransferase [Dyadobacter jejuensis]
MKLTPTSRKIILILYVSFGFLWGLGQAPLFDEDEAFFAEGTREMVLRNDFVSTFVNQEQRFDKPPLTNWLQYASAEVFGWSEWAMRLPSALAALMWMTFIYLFCKRRLGESAAFFATLVAASSLQITIIGKAALADSLLNATLAGAIFCLYEAIDKGINKKFLRMFFVLTGIGFLAKGPIAVLVPGATFLLFLLRWNRWNLLLKIWDPIGLLLFVAIAGPWYYLAYQASGIDFINGFFLSHNVNRFQTAFEGHYGGILYFVPVLILGLLPFTAVVLRALGRVRFLLHDSWFSFLLLWFLFVFVLFSMSGTKLHHYIIYGYTPLCAIGGWYMTQAKSLPLVWPSLLFMFLLTTIPFVVHRVTPTIHDAYALDIIAGVPDVFSFTYALCMGALIGILLLAAWLKSIPLELRSIMIGAVTLVTVNILWMPRLGALLQAPVKEAALLAKRKELTNIVVMNHYNPSFYYYATQFAQERSPLPGDLVFGRKASLKGFQIEHTYYEHYGIVLVRLAEN